MSDFQSQVHTTTGEKVFINVDSNKAVTYFVDTTDAEDTFSVQVRLTKGSDIRVNIDTDVVGKSEGFVEGAIEGIALDVSIANGTITFGVLQKNRK